MQLVRKELLSTRVFIFTQGGKILDLALGPVCDCEEDGIEDGEGALRFILEDLARTILQYGHVNVVVGLADADALAEEVHGRGGVAAAADACYGWHAGVGPAVDMLAVGRAYPVRSKPKS